MCAAGFTLIELLVVVGIIAILAGLASVNLLEARTRAKVAAGKSQLRVVSAALEMYRVDRGAYPVSEPTYPDDPLGVFAATALRSLTTPVAYVSPTAFRDPFGAIQMQTPTPTLAGDPFRPPEPVPVNQEQSLIYVNYRTFGATIGDRKLWGDGYAAISIGPDRRDSMIAYLPFPAHLPAAAAWYGVQTPADAVYDPTNGTVSGGDIAWFGGSLPVSQLVGGGD